MRVFLMGERVAEPANHPMIRPSINAMAATYALAEEDEELGTALSPFAGTRVNRFLHITESADDLVAKARLQDALGRRTGTCFRRCVGLDALNSLHSVTYEIDAHTVPVTTSGSSTSSRSCRSATRSLAGR